MKRGALFFLAGASSALLGCDGGAEKTRRHDPPEMGTTAASSAAQPRPKLVVRVDLAAIRIEGDGEPELVEATRDAAARLPAESIPKLASKLSPSVDLFVNIDPEVSMAALRAIANTARAAGLTALRVMPSDRDSVHQLELTADRTKQGKHVTLDRVPGNDLCDSMRDDPNAPMRRPVLVHVRFRDEATVRDLVTAMTMSSLCGIPEVYVLLEPA